MGTDVSVAQRDEAVGKGPDSLALRRRYSWFDLGLYSLMKLLSRIVAIVLFDVRIYNLHRLPRHRNFLLAPNHVSFLDPWLVGLTTPPVMTYLARDTLFKIPLLGWFIRHLNARAVKRGTSGARQGMQASVDALNQGCSLVLFPEGTRSPDGRLAKVKRGITLVIRRTNCLVVPAYIDGSFEIWPKGQRLPLTGGVRIVYGNPISPDGSESAASPALQTAERVKIPGRANEKSSGDLEALVENGWAQDSAESSPDRPTRSDRPTWSDKPDRTPEPKSPDSSRQQSSATLLEALGLAYRVLEAEARLRRWYRESPRRNTDFPPDFAPTTSQ